MSFDPIEDKQLSVLYSNRAMAEIILERYEDAEENCSHALLFDYKNIKARCRRRIALTGQGRYHEAISYFNKGLEKYPNDSDVLALLSEAQCKLAKAEEQLGDVYFKTGDYAEAVVAYARSINANATIAKVLSKRAKVYVRLQRLMDAESDASRALSLNHKCMDTRLLRGIVFLQLGLH